LINRQRRKKSQEEKKMAQPIRYTIFGERSKIVPERRRAPRRAVRMVVGQFERTKRDKTASELALEALIRELKRDEVGFSEQAARELANRYGSGLEALPYMNMKTLAVAISIYNQIARPDTIPSKAAFLDMKDEILDQVLPHVDSLQLSNAQFREYVAAEQIDYESDLYALLYNIRTMNSYMDRYIEYLTRESGRKAETAPTEARQSIEDKIKRNKAELLAYLRDIYLTETRRRGDIAEYQEEAREEGFVGED
jgi:hypothetical protein